MTKNVQKVWMRCDSALLAQQLKFLENLALTNEHGLSNVAAYLFVLLNNLRTLDAKKVSPFVFAENHSQFLKIFKDTENASMLSLGVSNLLDNLAHALAADTSNLNFFVFYE